MHARSRASQVPTPGSLNLDHVASFVPDRDDCERGLASLGFAPTPFSLQHHRLTPDGDLVPAGSGNHCVMLGEGYLEYLVPVADTPVAAQLRSAMARYVGAHSIVFGTAEAGADFARLAEAGFSPQIPIALQRDIETLHGPRTARFTVVRVPPGTMSEGRIQFCQHHTEMDVWQPRWLSHPNGAVALRSVFVCAEDVTEAARRYARFTGIEARPSGDRGWVLELERGRIEFFYAAGCLRRFGIAPPELPWIAGCEILSTDLNAALANWRGHGIGWHTREPGRVLVQAPAGVGGLLVFVDG